MHSSSSLSQRLGLHKLNSVLDAQRTAMQSLPERVTHDTLKQLHQVMTQGERWQEDEAFCQTLEGVMRNDEFREEFKKDTGQSLLMSAKPLSKPQAKQLMSFISAQLAPDAAPCVKTDLSVSFGQSLQNVMKDCLKQMTLDVLLETSLKLTGMDIRIAETFVPVITLIREARTALLAGDGNLVDRLKALTEALNTARNSLKIACLGSVVFKGTDILCDVTDVLHNGLASSDLSGLKAPVEKLGTLPGLASACQAILPLLELGEQFKQWNSGSITSLELVLSMLDRAMPQQLSLLMRTAAKIATAVQSGKLQAEGLPEWPKTDDKVACLQWLKAALLNDSLRETLAAADNQWLTQNLGLNAEEAECVHANLLQYAQPLARFPAQGTPAEWLMALKTMPGLSDMVTWADISLNDNLGAVGSLLKDNTTLSRLGGVATASGTTGKLWEALKLVDTGKSLTIFKDFSIEALKKTCGVAVDTASAIYLVLKKTHAFWLSAYSAGQSVSDPVRLYRDVFSFFKEDVKNNPDDYKNATVETLLATVAMVFKSVGGNHVPINFGGNTAEWLKAYAQADPEKLTAVDKVLKHAVLEPRVILEIKRAIQQEDTVQARKLLEPLSEALRSYTGDSPFLRQMAAALPYIPALNEAWKEMRVMAQGERQALESEIQMLAAIMRNSRKAVSADTRVSRQKAVQALQEKLGRLLEKCGDASGRMNALQAKLDATKLAVNTQPDESRMRLSEAQSGLNGLKDPATLEAPSPDEVTQVYARQASLHEKVKKTLIDERVSPEEIMQRQLKEMTKTLDAVPVEPKLTDMGSLVHFATEALTRLATSTKPNLVSARGELATLVRNAASDGLSEVVRWSGNQMMKLFTKEVELTPEEKALGMFVIEQELNAGQLATGAAAGAASGALLSVMFLLLSGEGIPGLKGRKESTPAVTMRTTATDINGESETQTVRLTPSRAGVYAATTEPLSREGNDLKKWLMLALPVVAGAAAGAGIAAAINPAIREKRGENDVPAGSNPAMTGPGQLHTLTGEDGITKGINVAPGQRLSHYRDNDGSMKTLLLEANQRHPLISTLAADPSVGLQENVSEQERGGRVIRATAAAARSTEGAPEQERVGRVKRGFGGGGFFTGPTNRKTPPARQTPPPIITHNQPPVEPPTEKLLEHIRSSWDMNLVMTKAVAPYMEGVLDGGETVLSKLHAPSYVWNYVQKAIDENKLSDHLKPDSRIAVTRTVTGGTGRTNIVVKEITDFLPLTDLVCGKFHGINLEVNWDSRIPIAFQQQILPGSERGLFTTGDSHSAIMETFNAEMAELKKNVVRKNNLSNFYDLSFKATAKELLNSNNVKDIFKHQLNQCVNGEKIPLLMSLNKESLKEVVALRIGSDVLAWDALGNSVEFKDNNKLSRKDQDWILDHLSINTKDKCQDSWERFETFIQTSITGNKIPIEHRYSRLSFNDTHNIGRDTANTSIHRMEENIDTLVKTPNELLRDQLVSIAFDAVGGVSALIPGSGIVAFLAKIALSSGITVAKDLTLATLADTYKEKTEILSNILQNIISGLVFEGITVGADLAGRCMKNRAFTDLFDTDNVRLRPTQGMRSSPSRLPRLDDNLKVSVDLSGIEPQMTGKYSGTYKRNFNYYIKQDGLAYEVFLDSGGKTLRLKTPGQALRSGYHKPVRFNADTNRWETHSDVGLAGGGKTWGSARIPQGLPSKMNPDPSSIGKDSIGKTPQIKRPDINGGQWVGAKGKYPILDSSFSVKGVDLSGVKIKTNGAYKGTYEKGGQHYIKQDGDTFEIFLDVNNHLRLKNPGQSQIEGEHARLHFNDETSGWETYQTVRNHGTSNP